MVWFSYKVTVTYTISIFQNMLALSPSEKLALSFFHFILKFNLNEYYCLILFYLLLGPMNPSDLALNCMRGLKKV